MSKVTGINIGLLIASLIGVLLSYYTLIIEIAHERDEKFAPMCDISEHVSCTKAFLSRYGKGFGLVGLLFGDDHILNLPNCILGLIFYTLISILSFMNTIKATRLLVFFNILANLSSIYLAYILYFVLYNLCVVCATIYVVNFVTLILSIVKLKRLKALSTTSSIGRSSKKTDTQKKKIKKVQ